MLAVEMGSRRGHKDQSKQSSKCGSNQSLPGAGGGGGYHPFYQLHPAWSHKPVEPAYSGPSVLQPLTQKHLQQHQERMQQQQQPGHHDLYGYPPPHDQHHHQQQKRSKSKDSSKKNEKSGFWNKSKHRSKSEQREKEKDEKLLRAEQVLRYQKAKEAADKKEAAERKKAAELAAERRKAADAAERKAEKSSFSRDDKKRKSGDSRESGLNHLKFWKSKRKSISEMPQSSTENVSAKQKRSSMAEYPVSSASHPQYIQHVGTEQVHMHVVQAPEQVEIVSVRSTPVPELPTTPIVVVDDTHKEAAVTEDAKDKENPSKKASRRSKSADSFRMKSSDSGFYSSRSKSPDSKNVDKKKDKAWKREKSLESIKSRGSVVKSSESVYVEEKKAKGTEMLRPVQRAESVQSKASVAKSTDSLQNSVKTESVRNQALRMVSSTPANLNSMDRNNNGRSAAATPAATAQGPIHHQHHHQPWSETPEPRKAEHYPGNTIKKSTTTTIVTRQRSFKTGGRNSSSAARSGDGANGRYSHRRDDPTAHLSGVRKVDYREFETDLNPDEANPGPPPPPPARTVAHHSPGKPKMLDKATKVIHDVTEMTKQTCYGTPNKTEGTPSSKEHKHTPLIPNYHSNHYPPQSHGQAIYISDKETGVTYKKGKLLGKGGFARCYELTNVKTSKTYAGKIIPKNIISKPHQREKIAREIDLHRTLRHRNVVLFHSSFEDDDNVYIILENCSRKSLVHVLKARQTLTEPEVRYYVRQLVAGCQYTHDQHIIHRDLKLGNMLLNDKMHVKIADFGLATRVEYLGEKKMSVCGTPNYIAPEVLQKKGHSYEADIWAMGCIMYAMLVGRPPFETSTLKETYVRITANKYFIPSHVSRAGRALIQKLLHPIPEQRPTLQQILNDDFFSAGHCPRSLSTSCCHSVPKFPSASTTAAPRPKSFAAPVSPSDAMSKITSSLAQLKGSKKASSQIISSSGNTGATSTTPGAPLIHVPPGTPDSNLNHALSSCGGSRDLLAGASTTETTTTTQDQQEQRPPPNYVNPASVTPASSNKEPLQEVDMNCQQQQQQQQQRGVREVAPMSVTPSSLSPVTEQPSSPPPYSRQTSADSKGASAIRLYQMLSSVLDQLPPDSQPSPVLDSKPLWVTKWVDYSNKYGFGFQLSDKSCGVLFNDTTRMFLAADGRTIQYNDLSNRVYTLRADSVPQEYHQKSTLLVYFAQYMDEHLIHGGDMLQVRAGGTESPPSPPPQAPAGVFMKKWFRTNKAIVMYLSNGTLQVNFFEDHTKVVLSPSEGQDYLVTYINSQRQAVSYRLLQFRHFGCHSDIAQRLSYARRELENIINIAGEAV